MDPIKPWDARLAAALVRPLHGGSVTPNQITTLGLLLGLAAALLYATGDPQAAGWAAALYLLSALVDHADGELARQTGRCSRLGYYYDQAAGAAVYLALFAGISVGLRHGPLGDWALPLGIAAGVAVALTLSLRFDLETRGGKEACAQPGVGGFEMEDAMYLLAPITWLGGIDLFLIAAGLGAPIFALWQGRQFVRLRLAARGGQP